MKSKFVSFALFFIFLGVILSSGCTEMLDELTEELDQEGSEDSEDDSADADQEESDDQDSEEEVETHLGCSEGECVEIVGSGEDRCTNRNNCSHYECELFECVYVNKAGTDQCTEDSDCYEVVETDFPVAVTANMPGTGSWEICMFTTGAWDTIDDLCECKGYEGLGPRDGGPACYFSDEDETYDWEVDSCNTVKGENLGSGRALTKFRCMIY